MNEFLKGMSTVEWGAVFILVNQLVTIMTNWISRKFRSKDMKNMPSSVKQIQKELTHNGGDTNLLTDKIDRIGAELQRMRVQQRARFEWALNRLPDSIFLFDEKGRCTFANKALQTAFGMSNEEIADDGWLKVIENQAERMRVKIAFDFSIKEQIAFNEDFILTHQGVPKIKIKMSMALDPIWDDDGSPIWFIAEVKMAA